MKKLMPVFAAVLLIVAAGLLLPSFIARAGNEKMMMINQDRNVAPFSAISVSGSMNVFVEQGSQSVKISGDENLVEKIKTEVKDGTLEISFDKSVKDVYDMNKKIEVHISLPQLMAVSLAGSGDITGQSKFNGEKNFSISLTGSGNINLSVDAMEMNASIAGSGDVLLNGKASEASVDIAGSGDFVGDKFSAAKANVSIAGSGDAMIHVDDALNASIVGSGDILYSGNATVKSSRSGSGDIVKKSL